MAMLRTPPVERHSAKKHEEVVEIGKKDDPALV